MSWHYLQGQAVASWEGACLDGAPDALSSLMPTPGASFLRGSETDISSGSLSGTTSAPSTGSRGEVTSTSSRAASHAKTSASQARAQALKAAGRAYGERWRASFAKWHRDGSFWRTPQCSLLEASTSYSGTWPRWGMMRAGACSELDTLAPHTDGTASGLRLATPTATANQLSPSMRKHPGCRAWATPTARDYKDSPGMSLVRKDGRHRLDLLPRQVYYLERQNHPTPVASDTGHRTKNYAQGVTALSMVVGGQLNPTWVAWLMGWPIGWTDCEPLGMDRFQQWRRLHGDC